MQGASQQIAWNNVAQQAMYSPPPALTPWEIASPTTALYRRAFGQQDPLAPSDPVGPLTTKEQQQGGALIAGMGAAMVVGIVILAVAINYQYGKAMAPNKQVEKKWAWGNAIGGTIFPPFTVGMAVYKNYFI